MIKEQKHFMQHHTTFDRQIPSMKFESLYAHVSVCAYVLVNKEHVCINTPVFMYKLPTTRAHSFLVFRFLRKCPHIRAEENSPKTNMAELEEFFNAKSRYRNSSQKYGTK